MIIVKMTTKASRDVSTFCHVKLVPLSCCIVFLLRELNYIAVANLYWRIVTNDIKLLSELFKEDDIDQPFWIDWLRGENLMTMTTMTMTMLTIIKMINRSGFTGQRVKPLLNLPHSLMRGFEEALLAKVNVISILCVIIIFIIIVTILDASQPILSEDHH